MNNHSIYVGSSLLQLPGWIVVMEKIKIFFSSVFRRDEGMREREKRFVEILNEYNPVISGICFSYSTSADDMKDLRQDILINIWKGLKNFRGDSSVSTWIYRVALNTCVSTVRKRYRKPVTVPIETQSADAPSDGEENLNDRINSLHAAIATLSPLDKAVITMWLDEKKYEEIAEVTGITRNNVAIRINRIKQKLAEKLEKI